MQNGHQAGRDFQRELILSPNEFAYVSDQTKGYINCFVGPHKTTLESTDQPMLFDSETKKFKNVELNHAKQIFATAPEGWYLILKNPAEKGSQPEKDHKNISKDTILNIGNKVNIPGPESFALWPGQMAKVVQGHRLRTNQYIVVRVYDDVAAEENWSKAVIKTQTEVTTEPPKIDPPKIEGSQEGGEGTDGQQASGETQETAETKPAESIIDVKSEDLAIGKLYIIKGTDVSFYIPPTGVEVVPDDNGAYIREAVTLEQLDYCVLLDENGKKDFRRGPDVVFPNPTQTFMISEKNGKRTRKFKAIQLNEISGLYIKVIAPYTQGNKEYKEGDELFITGKDQMIYFPRPEHSIIKYGGKEIHYAVAIPKGEARYVLDRISGEIKTVKGPHMLLPDPRTKVIVRRILNSNTVGLLYPNNTEALNYNKKLEKLRGHGADDFVTDKAYSSGPSGPMGSRGLPGSEQLFAMSASKGVASSTYQQPDWAQEEAGEGFVGDSQNRKTSFTQPRTVTIDSKYDGAVKVQIWTGYAVLVVDGEGNRDVVVGPAKFNLDYDQTLEKIIMSTGKPKNTDHLHEDVYLRVKNNKVADVITAETSDLVGVSIKVSYRLNFIGDPEKWFDVENYVKFLCDHMRSLVKGKIQTMTINEFYGNSIDIIRGIILNHDAEPQYIEEEGSNNMQLVPPKKGRLFEENGMHVYDVEVLKAEISDHDLAYELSQTQQDIVMGTIKQKKEETLLTLETQTNEISKKRLTLTTALADAKSKAEIAKADSQKAIDDKNNEIELTELEHTETVKLKNATMKGVVDSALTKQQLELQDDLDKIAEAELLRKQAEDEHDLDILTKKGVITITANKATSDHMVAQLTAVQPKLVESLQALAQVSTIKDIMPELVPLSIVEGKNVGNTITDLLGDTAVGAVLKKLGGPSADTKQLEDSSTEEASVPATQE